MDLTEELEAQLHEARDVLRCDLRTAIDQMADALRWEDVIYYGTNASDKVLNGGNLIPNDDELAHVTFRLEVDDAVIDAVFNASGEDRPTVFVYDRRQLARSMEFRVAKEDNTSRVELIVQDQTVPLGLGLIAMVSIDANLEWLALGALKQVASGDCLPITDLEIDNTLSRQA